MHRETLALLIERARARTDAAQLRRAKLARLVEQAREHLDLLRQYAAEYDARAMQRTGDVRDPSAQQNQISFLARLRVAVEAQERELAIREATATAAAAELAQCRQKQLSLETLYRRQLEALRQVEARRDQKNTDEFAQRTHERRMRTREREAEAETKRST
jgi:flagellar FliJ protein